MRHEKLKLRSLYPIVLSVVLVRTALNGQTYALQSPDKAVFLEINVGAQLSFSVSYKNASIVTSAAIGMNTEENGVLGRNMKVADTVQRNVKQVIRPEVRIKAASIDNTYNELEIRSKNNYAVTFRAYNDGVAYRFSTTFADSFFVNNEMLDLTLPAGPEVYSQPVQGFFSHYEFPYEPVYLENIPVKSLEALPLMFNYQQQGIRMLFSEADLYDYPGMYLRASGKNRFSAVFPPVVKKEKEEKDRTRPGWDRNFPALTTYDFIADAKGTRQFPWRFFVLTDDDKTLLTNQMVYKLSRPLQLSETDWIKPGKVAWDWWNNLNITGVDFKVGINNETYKYYIDFADHYGLDYILLDEGWYQLGDITRQVPSINVPELVKYAARKNVGLILWVVWKQLDQQMEKALDLYQKWGVKGIKVDFMQRDDQYMVNFYERVAREAARRKLLVDFHGCFKPTGMERAYPNVLTREGVMGLEHNKWEGMNANPEMAVTLPFIRMVAGPMDYTPGAMLNSTREDYKPNFNRPMSLGTRCQQLAMYIVYDSPLQMLADSPVHYEQEPESTEFIAGVPTVWDTTIVLAARLGDYLVMARRKEDEWYLAGMTDWTQRDVTLDLSFLPDDRYVLELFRDGYNAARNAMDYKKETIKFQPSDKIKVKMAPGGGMAGRIVKAR